MSARLKVCKEQVSLYSICPSMGSEYSCPDSLFIAQSVILYYHGILLVSVAGVKGGILGDRMVLLKEDRESSYEKVINRK